LGTAFALSKKERGIREKRKRGKEEKRKRGKGKGKGKGKNSINSGYINKLFTFILSNVY